MAVTSRQNHSPADQDPVRQRIRAAGHGEEDIQPLLDFEVAMFRFVRSLKRGELPRQVLSELGLDLDLAGFHALTAVRRIELGIGRAGAAEPTVGLLAEELEVDPSRASRLASDLISRSYLRRLASQEDGRRTILALTPKAQDALAAFRLARWDHHLARMDGWTHDEVATFSRLFARFVGEG